MGCCACTFVPGGCGAQIRRADLEVRRHWKWAGWNISWNLKRCLPYSQATDQATCKASGDLVLSQLVGVKPVVRRRTLLRVLRPAAVFLADWGPNDLLQVGSAQRHSTVSCYLIE